MSGDIERRGYTQLQLSREIERITAKMYREGNKSLTKLEWTILHYGRPPCRCSQGVYRFKSDEGFSTI